MIWRIVGGFLAQFWKPIALFLGGWLGRGQREKIKDLKAEQKARERMDDADHFDDSDDATNWLRDRADKRDL